MNQEIKGIQFTKIVGDGFVNSEFFPMSHAQIASFQSDAQKPENKGDEITVDLADASGNIFDDFSISDGFAEFAMSRMGVHWIYPTIYP